MKNKILDGLRISQKQAYEAFDRIKNGPVEAIGPAISSIQAADRKLFHEEARIREEKTRKQFEDVDFNTHENKAIDDRRVLVLQILKEMMHANN